MPRGATVFWAMLIVCPNCASRYEIAEAKIGVGGRKVRCASCQTTWQIEAPQAAEPPPTNDILQSDLDAAIPDLPSAPTPEQTAAELEEELRRAGEIDADISAITAERAEARQPDASQPPPSRKRSWAGARNPLARLPSAAASVLVVAGVAVLGLGFWQRERVVRAMPQFADLYAKIGLPVNVRGLAFSAVESELVQDPQGRFLVITGDVTNITRGTTKVPPITVTVQAEDGKVLYSWTTEPPRPSLESAELMHFRARLASPPENGRSVQLRFGATNPNGIAALY